MFWKFGIWTYIDGASPITWADKQFIRSFSCISKIFIWFTKHSAYNKPYCRNAHQIFQRTFINGGPIQLVSKTENEWMTFHQMSIISVSDILVIIIIKYFESKNAQINNYVIISYNPIWKCKKQNMFILFYPFIR